MAQELGKWAESLGKGDEFHHAVFRSYFADGRNIGDISTLIEVGKTLGLPESDMRDVLETEVYKSAVDSDWARAYEMGINAVPSFMMNQQVVVGAQPYNVLVNFMESNQIARRSTQS
jgi:predicted DsbA family dithiol-disulfide isomerase